MNDLLFPDLLHFCTVILLTAIIFKEFFFSDFGMTYKLSCGPKLLVRCPLLILWVSLDLPYKYVIIQGILAIVSAIGYQRFFVRQFKPFNFQP